MNQHYKVGFIGAGNITQTFIKGWSEAKHISPTKIYVANRTPRKLQKLVDAYKINGCESNESVIENSDIVILAVKPQNMIEALEPLRSAFNPNQVVLSVAAGITLDVLKRYLTGCRIGRLMPNTPTAVGKGVIGFCHNSDDEALQTLVEDLFSPLGLVIPTREGDMLDALTIATASGPGFIFEMMQIWQEWIEQFEIEPEVARAMTLQTFLGTAELAKVENQQSFYDLQSKVVSKKGITAAGLESLREREIDSVLRYSFERAAMRAREIAKIQ